MNSDVELVRRFRRLRALVIGDAILDTYLEGTAERLCVEGPAPVVRKQAEQRLPGGAANTAANLRALGASVTYLGVIGRDASGAMLKEALRARGVETRGLIEDETAPTQHKLRIIADGQFIVRFDEGTTQAPGAHTRRRLLHAVETALPQSDVVVISDYCYGALDDDVIAHIQALRLRHAIPLVVDSKQLERFTRCAATIVTPNLTEARALIAAHGAHLPRDVAATPGEDAIARQAEGARLATALLALLDCELAAVTLAGDGVALAARDGRQWHIAAHPVARPNDVGAGDSFASALALALAAGAQPEGAARIGVDAAGIAVSKRFTAQVEQRELLQRVSLRERAGVASGAATPATRRSALQRTQARLEAERAAGKVIVFTNGVFDVLHAGHIEFLRRAKALGDILVVGVNSDESGRRLHGQRPLLTSERDRLALMSALEPVDYALLFDEETPERLIYALRPEIHVKGGDYADEALPESVAVRAVGGRVVILPLASERDRREDARASTLAAERIVSLTADAELAELADLAGMGELAEMDGDHAHAG